MLHATLRRAEQGFLKFAMGQEHNLLESAPLRLVTSSRWRLGRLRPRNPIASVALARPARRRSDRHILEKADAFPSCDVTLPKLSLSCRFACSSTSCASELEKAHIIRNMPSSHQKEEGMILLLLGYPIGSIRFGCSTFC
ncbi:Uncharacterised protein [Bacillus freudenreichii]|nr:Uncharacterised protein [Bacillus freudenreichii]